VELQIDNLIKLIKKRNQEALKRLMDLYIGSVYSVAKNILVEVASIEDIEECTNDVFVDVWNNIDKYDETRGSIKTWILILCKYKALNIKKTLNIKNKVIALEKVQIKDNEDIEGNYIIKERKEEILQVIKSFDKVDKEIFLKRYFWEQRIDEICACMNMSRQAVDNRLWRGRNRIKKIINSNERREINE
jgi:RNA polymerase sigma-70 factor (ECF subfamily)